MKKTILSNLKLKKQLFFVLTILALSNLFVEAQEKADSTTATSLIFCTGETSLVKGNTLSGVFSHKKSLLIVDLNENLQELLYFYSPVKNLYVGGSGGFFQNTPWFGPIGTFEFLDNHVKILSWFGWSTGDPEKRETAANLLFCFSYQQISVNYYGFELSYANQIYQKNPVENIFNLKKTFKPFKFEKQFLLFLGGGYMIRAEHYLWSGGLIYNL